MDNFIIFKKSPFRSSKKGGHTRDDKRRDEGAAPGDSSNRDRR